MCVQALLGDETDDEDAKEVGGQLVAEALCAIIGYRLIE